MKSKTILVSRVSNLKEAICILELKLKLISRLTKLMTHAFGQGVMILTIVSTV